MCRKERRFADLYEDRPMQQVSFSPTLAIFFFHNVMQTQSRSSMKEQGFCFLEETKQLQIWEIFILPVCLR
jgi:hypothetical protein